LVFLTKYRKAVFTKTILDALQEIFSKVCIDFEAELVEFDGETDHVHLLVNSLKGASSRRLRTRFPELKNHYWKNMLWSPSYFAGSCGGAPIETIRKYIEQQKTPL